MPSIENSRRVRLGDRAGGFFVGNRGDRWPSWLARESLGDFLNSMFILWHKDSNIQSSFFSPFGYMAIFSWCSSGLFEVHLYNSWHAEFGVTCFLGITSVTSSQPTHRSAQCHWSQSSCSCQCTRSWDSHTPPLETNIHKTEEVSLSPVLIMASKQPCVKTIIKKQGSVRSDHRLKANLVQSGHRAGYFCVKPQTVTSDNSSHHRSLYSFLVTQGECDYLVVLKMEHKGARCRLLFETTRKRVLGFFCFCIFSGISLHLFLCNSRFLANI